MVNLLVEQGFTVMEASGHQKRCEVLGRDIQTILGSSRLPLRYGDGFDGVKGDDECVIRLSAGVVGVVRVKQKDRIRFLAGFTLVFWFGFPLRLWEYAECAIGPFLADITRAFRF